MLDARNSYTCLDVVWSVCLSACLFISAKTAELTEMPFEGETRVVDPGMHVLDGGAYMGAT